VSYCVTIFTFPYSFCEVSLDLLRRYTPCHHILQPMVWNQSSQ